jgi:hypothetical protein
VTKIIGILTIILGFLAPFLSAGRIPPVLLFWIGFLLLLRTKKSQQPTAEWQYWSRIGLLIHVLGNSFVLFYTYILLNTFLSGSYLAGLLSRMFYFLASPVSSLGSHLFPHPKFTMPDGSVQIHVSFLRGTITSFLNVIVYLLVGVGLGKLTRLYSKNHLENMTEQGR